MSVSFDREAYYRRIKRLYAGWTKGRVSIEKVEKKNILAVDTLTKGDGNLAQQDVLMWAVGQSDEDQYRFEFSRKWW